MQIKNFNNLTPNNNIMKKLYSTMMLLATIVAALSFAACGDDDGDVPSGGSSFLVGTWSVNSHQGMRGDLGEDEFEYFQLKSDGTYVDVLYDDGFQISRGTWRATETTLILEGDIKGTLTYEIYNLTQSSMSLLILDITVSVTKVPDSIIEKYLNGCSEYKGGSLSSSYVDLGLPSGTLWATCNIGASNPEDYGDYFTWGETEGYNSGKTNFNWSTYKWCNGTDNSLTKYNTDSSYGNVDNKTELNLNDDAAYVNRGPEWRIPTYDQFQELINSNYTTNHWISVNGVLGHLITSKMNGNFIFLPAAGSRYDNSLSGTGSWGHYWSRSLGSEGGAWYLRFGSSSLFLDDRNRSRGQSVRPVRR